MRPTRWTIFALVGWLVAVVGAVGGLLVRIVWPASVVPTTFGISGPTALVALAVLGMTWSTVGALLVIRRPENRVGRIMIVVGAGFAVSVLTMAVASAALAKGTAPDRDVASVAGGLTALLTPTLVLVLYLSFIFPTGRGQTPRWDTINRIVLMVAMIVAVLLVFQPGDVHLLPGIPNPVGFGPDLRPLFGDPVVVGAGVFLFAIATPIQVLSVASRYRAAARTERQQLKWFILATAGIGGAMVVMNSVVVVTRGPIGETPLVAFASAGTAIPLAIGVAILRYRLYDIDKIVSRTISYGLISGILVATYAAVIVVLQGPLGAFLGSDSISVALSTLAVAALFQPLRRRVQRVVERRFDRARYDGERTAVAFSERLRNEVDIATVIADLRDTVASSIKPSRVGLWLRDPNR
jgi:hypothetical protein